MIVWLMKKVKFTWIFLLDFRTYLSQVDLTILLLDFKITWVKSTWLLYNLIWIFVLILSLITYQHSFIKKFNLNSSVISLKFNETSWVRNFYEWKNVFCCCCSHFVTIHTLSRHHNKVVKIFLHILKCFALFLWL